MNKEKEKILIRTAVEYFDSGEEESKKQRYNSALVLYFKSLIALTDLLLLRKTGNTPSSHTSRFRMCQESFSDIYNLIDKDFPFYQDSYSQLISKELAEVIRDDAQTVAQKLKIKL
ncbi:MAG: hypothetical protein KKF50_03210 [Nanoarchaeota archaeon]|nr:hypothetical protein [Nanoarchaeota archaeon]